MMVARLCSRSSSVVAQDEMLMRMATFFAQHAAVAIENARLKLAATMADVPSVSEV